MDMENTPLTNRDAWRLKEIKTLMEQHTLPKAQLDRITHLLTDYFNVPMAAISLIDGRNQWFQSTQGLTAQRWPIEQAIDVLLLQSTSEHYTKQASKHPLLKDLPKVKEPPNVTFAATAPLQSKRSGYYLGTVSLYDDHPRDWLDSQQALLERFADLVSDLIHNTTSTKSSLYYDELTGFANEALFKEQIELEKDTLQPGECLLITCFEIDRLAAFLNLLPHEHADQLMKEIAEHLNQHLMNKHVIGKGDLNRFFAMFPLAHDSDYDIIEAVKSILRGFDKTFKLGDNHYRFNVHIGCVLYPDTQGKAHELIGKSILAMHTNRDTPYSDYHFYDESHDNELKRILMVENNLRQALEKKAIKVALQPIVKLPEQTLESFEALCRWHDQELGWVSPGEFIPLAERCGLDLKITEIMLEKVITHLAHTPEASRIPISVNIPSGLLTHVGLVNHIIKTLEAYAISGAYLRLEITESGIIKDFNQVHDPIQTLRHHGIHFGIDDFGTGFSSLSYLTRIPIQFVKMDQLFVNDMVENEADAALIESMIQLAHRLGYETVAEGVNTQEKLIYLKAYQCSKAQGHYFGSGELIE